MTLLLILLCLCGGGEAGGPEGGFGPNPTAGGGAETPIETTVAVDPGPVQDPDRRDPQEPSSPLPPDGRSPLAELPPDLPRRTDARVVVPADPALGARLRLIHWVGDEGRADRAIAVLERDPDLPGLPPGLPTRAEIFLAPDREIFDALTGGQVPHWGAGVAIPARGRIVIPLFGNPWTGGEIEARTLRHEWAHLGLHERLAGLRIPRWFDEGYAQWASGGWDVGAMWRLRVALARGNAPPLDSLSLLWPRDRSEAELAYLLSASAVSFLLQDSGARGLEVFVDRWAETREFERSFRRTFGMATGTFETRWVRHVKQRYGWILLFSHSIVFWGLLAVVLLLLFRIRRRRDRERMAALRATEPPDLPAFWEPPRHPPIGGFEGERHPSRGDHPGAAGELDPPVPSR